MADKDIAGAVYKTSWLRMFGAQAHVRHITNVIYFTIYLYTWVYITQRAQTVFQNQSEV